MADQRMVGHAIRRREGSAASHLGQAQGGAMANGGYPSGSWRPGRGGTSAGGEAAVVRGGGVQQGRLKGVPDVYETGTASTGRGTSARNIISTDPTEFVSGVSAGRETEPHPPRGKLPQAEAAGARLTISPSMKTPTESPVPTQGQGYVVPSTPSRSGQFSGGMEEAHRG